jgi:hypothetical protein
MSDELRVMMLTWEFPPRIIGGISPHVYYLSRTFKKTVLKSMLLHAIFQEHPTHERWMVLKFLG